MHFILISFILLLLELLYFKLAEKFNIVDKPNYRSSHTITTLRGGGVIFYFSALAYFFYSGFEYPWFFFGLTLMTMVSFLDDIRPLSNKLRLFIHFLGVLLVAYQWNIYYLPWHYLIIVFIAIVGVVNAYNFMDGINGMTASYSVAVGILLMVVNSEIKFIDQYFLAYILISLVIFAFFNFRVEAKTFAGDVGSVTMAYILLFILGTLVIKTGHIIYILFLAVYGIDTIWTIIRRIYLKENIFHAHRSHLYQYLANESRINKLLVSFLYGFTQFLIGIVVIFVANYSPEVQIIFSVGLLSILSIIYLVIKSRVIKNHVVKNEIKNV